MKLILLSAACLGIFVADQHTLRGGMEKSTWPALAEAVYSLIGIFVVCAQLSNHRLSKEYTLFVTSVITSYHMVLCARKTVRI